MPGFDAVAARWRDLSRAHLDLWALCGSGLAIDTPVEFVVDDRTERDTIRTLYQFGGDILVILPGGADGSRRVSHEMAALHCAHVARRIDALMLLMRLEGAMLTGLAMGGGWAAFGSAAAADWLAWSTSGVFGFAWTAGMAAVRRRFARWAVRVLARRLLKRFWPGGS